MGVQLPSNSDTMLERTCGLRSSKQQTKAIYENCNSGPHSAREFKRVIAWQDVLGVPVLFLGGSDRAGQFCSGLARAAKIGCNPTRWLIVGAGPRASSLAWVKAQSGQSSNAASGFSRLISVLDLLRGVARMLREFFR